MKTGIFWRKLKDTSPKEPLFLQFQRFVNSIQYFLAVILLHLQLVTPVLTYIVLYAL